MKKNIFSILIILGFIFSGFFVYAEENNTGDSSNQNPPIEENQLPVEPPVEDPAPILLENVFIRNGPTVVYSGDIALPAEGNIDILDNTGVVHSVNSRSVLGVLYTLDQAEDSFSLSSLQYYESFSSFYLKCLNIGSSSDLCDSWQYVVGGTSPWTSVDTTILSGGESIGLYFGNPYKVDLDSNSITTSGFINAQAKTYNYLDDTWVPRTGVSVDITQVNPNDPWSPIVISTTPVDMDGGATLSFNSPGVYNVGISEDYYFPSYTVSVSEPASSGGSNSVPVEINFSKENAISFLNLNKKIDGSFGSMLYTDWVAVAFQSTEDLALASVLSEYLKSNNFTSSTVTDNERHAMALMALGINPYSGTNIDYISKIVGKFDGIQIGDTNLDNDDIFGLIVLKKAGYSYKDEIIANTIDFIKTKQYSNGSWDNSADMTSAAIMSLYPFKNRDGVSDSIDRAYGYLTSGQSSDGSISGNVSSTSWMVQAMSLDSQFSVAMAKARNYIALQQKSDGGIGEIGSDIDSRVWATSYALTAESLKSWIDILPDFDKPSAPEPTNSLSQNTPAVVVIEKVPVILENIDIPKIEEDKEKIIEIIQNKNQPQNEEIKNIPPVEEVVTEVKKSNLGNSLVASAGQAPIKLKMPLVLKAAWKGIVTFFTFIFSFF